MAMSISKNGLLHGETLHLCCPKMKKILVIRFSSIGDIVMTSAVVRCLKQQIPFVELHYLTKERFSELIRYNPNIDRVYTLDDNWDDLVQALRHEKYDAIVDLHQSIRSLRLVRQLKRKTFVVKKYSLQKALYARFGWNWLPKNHAVDRTFDVVKRLQVTNDGKGLEFHAVPNTLEPEGLPTRFIAVAVGAAHQGKQCPANIHVQILNQLQIPVVLIGGKDDEELANQIAASVSVQNLVGKLSISQSALVIARCKVLITNDTGMMHVGAAYKKPIISLWGQTTPLFGLYPYLPGEGSKMFETAPPRKRKISKLGNKPIGNDHDMNHLPVNQIVESINQILQSENGA
jgi:ADP-heptose:LPS heptosyltransferase